MPLARAAEIGHDHLVGEIGLEEAIRAVRAELTEAMAAGTDEAIRFRVGSVELDFQVTIDRSADASAKVRFWVVDVSASPIFRVMMR